MSRALVTVAIPVRNGGELFARVLAAIGRQVLDAEVEVIVADSGSSDGSAAHARECGARVIEIPAGEFSHGATRNLLLREAAGSHVALLSQDAEPINEHWLEHLLGGFERDRDVALAYGPYVARPGASSAVRLELERWFGSLQAGAERLTVDERALPAVEFLGRRGFFTSANACIARSAWELVPFREIGYAEDRAIALDMLRAGYAKVYEPLAGVVHSHEYRPRQRFARAFDEARGVQEVYGWREPLDPRHLVLQVRGELGGLRRDGAGLGTLVIASRDRLLSLAGAVLGSRASRLPATVQRLCSLERRASR